MLVEPQVCRECSLDISLLDRALMNPRDETHELFDVTWGPAASLGNDASRLRREFQPVRRTDSLCDHSELARRIWIKGKFQDTGAQRSR
jgi:hypothetical protein